VVRGLCAGLILCGLFFAPIGRSLADAVPFYVIQDGKTLGIVEPFSGTGSAKGFYDYHGLVLSAFPRGVPQESLVSSIFLYSDTRRDVVGLGVLHGMAGQGLEGSLTMRLRLIGQPSYTPNLIVPNDPGEIKQIGSDVWRGSWQWGDGENDGGMWNNLGRAIDPHWAANLRMYTSSRVAFWQVIGADGQVIRLDKSLPVTLRPVPEPVTLALFGLGLAGGGVLIKRRRRG